MSAFQLRQAARVIRSGGIVAYPTEAVYGLGCDPLSPTAVYRLLNIKQRSVDKGLILIAASVNQLAPYIGVLDTGFQQVLDSWPGPYTWLLPARPGTPCWLTGKHTSIAVRVTDHPLAAALCSAVGGPLVSTSANRSGQPPARNALQVRLRFPHGIDKLLCGSTGGLAQPTAIKDAVTGTSIRT